MLLFLISIPQCLSQAIGNCPGGYSKATIEGENIRAQVNNRGDFYWDPDSARSRFEWPKNSSTLFDPIFAGGMWFGGLDKSTGSTKLNVAVQTYRGPLRNFWPGPVPSANTTPSQAYCQFWDRIFCVSKDSVEEFVTMLQNAPGPNPFIPESIRNWPGRGNPFLKAQAQGFDFQTIQSVDQANAPFFDADTNGIYNPSYGDYPDIQNRLMMCYEVINDIGNTKNFPDNTVAVPGLGLEFHLMFSTYPSNSNAHYLANSIFTDITFYNKGSITMDSAYIGLWLDPKARLLQSDVMRNMGIMYGKIGSGSGVDHTPAIGFKAFDGPYSPPNDLVDNNRNGVVDETDEKGIFNSFTLYQNGGSPINGDATKATDFYNYLNSRWKNGAQITYDLNASNPACRFMYPGSSDPVGYGMGGTPQNPVLKPAWTMTQSGVTLFDRRMVMAAGPFTLQPGEVEKYSYVNLIGFGGDSAQNLHMVELISDSLDGYLPILTSKKEAGHSADFQVHVSPNPSTGTYLFQSGFTMKHVEIRDVLGRLVFTQKPDKATTTANLSGFRKGLFSATITTQQGQKTIRLVLE